MESYRELTTKDLVWNMDEHDYERMKQIVDVPKSKEEADKLRELVIGNDDTFGQLQIGAVDFDFQCNTNYHESGVEYRNGWYLYCNPYILGVDSGYGETEDGRPYALVCGSGKGYITPDPWTDKADSILASSASFEEFKEAFGTYFLDWYKKLAPEKPLFDTAMTEKTWDDFAHETAARW